MSRKDEGRRQKDQGRFVRGALSVLLFSSFILRPSSFSLAAPSQEEVLRSINNQVGQKVDADKLLAFGLLVLAAVGVLILINHARNRSVNPRPLNSPGKLLKEVAREMHLRPAEVRQLRMLAERQQITSPLVLLLCPSLLTRAVREHPELADRDILTSLARKTIGKDT